VLRTLDRESISVYHLNISATDSGAPAMTSQTLLQVHVDDVNDNVPVFLQRVYHAVVLEEQQPPVAVVTVSATDFDDPTSMYQLHCIHCGRHCLWPLLSKFVATTFLWPRKCRQADRSC